jgi:aromatic-L-amino-acid decarboxylase
MNSQTQASQEETLDPQDWGSLRLLGHQMLDDMFDYLRDVRQRPVWQPIPGEVKENMKKSLPRDPQPIDAIYQNFRRDILPYPLGNIHPRFWGWVIGTGSATGMLAEMLAAGMNPNAAGGDQVSNYVEQQVIDWCKEMLGYPQVASGVLVSGASIANLVGLAVARNTKAGFNVRQQGLQGNHRKLVLYTSKEAHSCIKKAVELLGLGDDSLRLISVNTEYQIDLTALQEAIAADRTAGMYPFCVVGNAGTVNTGAIDDLKRLVDICQSEDLWFHVDGAFGSLAAISPRLRPLLEGMQQADSLALDLHKWMYMPYDIACALVRDPQAHRRTFAERPDYLAHAERGIAGGELWFSDLGVQLSRGFRALKAWILIQEHGIDKYARMIEQNVAQAQYLGKLVDANPLLERLAPVSLNIVCFRYNPGEMDENNLNRLNEELLIRLHESGIAAPSSTNLGGRYVIRVANTNHRSRREDFDLLVEAVLRFGKEVQAEAQLEHAGTEL